MANERRIRITTEFDGKAIYSGLNKLKQELNSMSVDSSLFKDVQKDIDKISKFLPSIMSGLKDGIPQKNLSAYLKTLDNVTELYKQLPQKIKQVQINTNDLRLPNNVEDQYERLGVQAEGLSNKIKKLFGDELKQKIKNALPKELFDSSFATSVADTEKGLGKFDDKLKKVRGTAEETKGKLLNILKFDATNTKAIDLSKQLDTAKTIQEIDKIKTSLKDAFPNSNKGDQKFIIDLQNQLDKYGKSLNQVVLLEQSRANIEQILNNTNLTGEQLRQQLTKALSDQEKILNSELERQNQLQKNAANAASTNGKKVATSMEEVKNSATKTNESLVKQDSLLKQLASRATSLIGIGAIFNYITRGVREAWQGIKDLDKEFTQIAVVTDKTTSQLWSSFGTYSQMAQALGVTTKDAVATSALYYQQGLKTADVMTLTAETIKMAQIAGMDFATATNQMTAAIRGFNLEMEDASKVNDIFSTLAANAAVSTEELAYALTKTASIAESAGMSIDTTSAFLTKMIETTREAPENIGTAMKSIVARFEELKKNPLALKVEVDGEEVVANKVEAAIALAGVRLRDETTQQFRDLDEVFLELAKSWDNLDRNTQRYIATIAAGSRQQSRFIAMMDGYDRTLELVELAQDSEGQSAAQFLKTLDSLDSKLNQVSNSLEQIYQKFVNSDFFGGLLDSLNSTLQGLGKLDAGTLATFAVIGVTIGSKIIQGLIKSIGELGPQISTALKTKAEKIGNDMSAVEPKGLIYNVSKKVYDRQNQKVLNNLSGPLQSTSKNGRVINFDLDTIKAHQKVVKIQQEINDIKQNHPEEIKINDSEANQKIDELQNKINRIKKGKNYNVTDENGNVLSGNAKGVHEQLINSEAYKQYDSLEDAEKAALKKTQQIKASLTKAMSDIGPAMVSTLSIGITTALATNDPFATFVTSATTFAMSTLPNVFSNIATAIEQGKSVIEVAGGWITIMLKVVAGAIAILTPMAVAEVKKLIHDLRPQTEKIKDQIKELEEVQKQLDETAEKSTAEAAIEKTKYKNLQKIYDEYTKIEEKTVKTKDDIERIAELDNKIIQEFPELITSYDEAGNAVIKISDTWGEILEKQKESAKLALNQANIDKITAQSNQVDIAKANLALEKETLKDLPNVVRENRKNNVVEYVKNELESNLGEFGTWIYNSQKLNYEGSAKDATYLKYAGMGSIENPNDLKNYSVELANRHGYSGNDFNDALEYIKQIDNNTYDIINNAFSSFKRIGENGELQADIDKAKKEVENSITDYFIDYIKQFPLDEQVGQYSEQTLENFARQKAKEVINADEYSLSSLLRDESKRGDILKKADTLAEQVDALNTKNLTALSNLQSDSTLTLEKAFEDNAEGLETWEKLVQKYLEDVYENAIKKGMDELSALKTEMDNTGKEQDFEILSNMGAYGRNEVTQAYINAPTGKEEVFGTQYNDYQNEADKLIGTFSANIQPVINQLIDQFGTDLVKSMSDKKLGDQAIEAINDSLNSLNLSSLEASGLIELVDSIDNWGDPTQIKNLAEEIFNLTGNTEKAVQVALELRDAFTNPLNMDISVEALNSQFADLGKQISDIKKKYKDLNAAMEEYNTYGRMSGETILELVEAGQMQYLEYDKEAKAVKIKNELVEEGFNTEMALAKASLQAEYEKANVAYQALNTQITIEKKKLKVLTDSRNRQYTLEQNFDEEFLALDKEAATNIQDNQITVNNDALANDSEFFNTLYEQQGKEYQALAEQAAKYGQEQYQAYLSALQNGTQKVEISAATKGNIIAGSVSGKWSDLKTELNGKSEADRKAIIEAAIKDQEEYIMSLEEARNAYAEYMKNIKAGMDVIDAFTSSGMDKFFKDTSSALKEATKDLEEYVSKLEKYYTLIKRVEKAEKDRQKSLKQYKKTGSEEDLNNYIKDTKTWLTGLAQEASVGRKEKTNIMSETKEKLGKYFTQNELKEFQFDEETGLIDISRFRKTDAYKKSVESGKGKEVDEIINTSASDVEKYQGWIDAFEDAKLTVVDEFEDLKKTAEKMINSLDRLANIELAMNSIKRLLDEATALNEEYYTTGGREGINGSQYLRTQAETIQSEELSQKQYKINQEDIIKEINEKDLSKYLKHEEGDNKYYTTQEFANLAGMQDQTSQELRENIERLQKEYNNLTDKIQDSTKAQRDSAKAMRDFTKSLKQTYSDLITRVADDMAKLDQKEIDEVKKKYAMIQEEDNKYLEALQKSIDKQRQLREQAKSYDDLEKDEKRLALLERDTSGANAAEIAALREQIKDKRTNLVDTEQDNIVNNIAEDNKNRKEKMDEETEFLQNVMDERTYDMQYYLEKARDIVDAAINGDEGAYQRMLKIMEEAEEAYYRVTKEAQDSFLEQFQSDFKKAEDWVKISAEGYGDITKSTISEIKKISEKMSEGSFGASVLSGKIQSIDKEIQLIDKNEPFKILNERLKNANDIIDEIQTKITQGDWDIEATITYKEVREGDGNGTTITNDNKNNYKLVYDSSKGNQNIGVIDVNSETYKHLPSGSSLKFRDIDETNIAEANYFIDNPNKGVQWSNNTKKTIVNNSNPSNNANNNNLTNSGKDSDDLNNPTDTDIATTERAIDLYKERVGNDEDYSGATINKTSVLIPVASRNLKNLIEGKERIQAGTYNLGNGEYYFDKSALYSIELCFNKDGKIIGYYDLRNGRKVNKNDIGYKAFATGGLVDFTGPAWVDGTPSQPEAFLSASDTRNIQTLTEVLNNVISSAVAPVSVNKQETKNGDTNIEMHVNVEGVNETDEDWEETAQRVGEIFADSVKNQVNIVNTTI